MEIHVGNGPLARDFVEQLMVIGAKKPKCLDNHGGVQSCFGDAHLRAQSFYEFNM